MSLSDPETSTMAFSLLAVGDWGGTLGKDKGVPGTCCKLYNGAIDFNNPRYKVDFYAQEYIATLLATSAVELKPQRILSHGDNFYLSGVSTADAKYRIEQSFENVYNAPSLENVPWLNVAGNHDLGGNAFICGDADGHFRECASVDELLRYLDIRFEAQANYTSPRHNRWVLRDHYYVDRVAKHGTSVDIFNLDTNHADHHGAKDVCCQCFGYSAKFGLNQSLCDDAQRGDLVCLGGDVAMFDECVAKIETWASESYTRAMQDIKASTATFKIVNTHYSPHYHMNRTKMMQWYALCREAGVTAWFNGHTHGFSHDVAEWGTHFFLNGGGGGYWTRNLPGINNGLVKNQWRVEGNPYGFMELIVSKDWLQVRFATFDDQWTFGGLDRQSTVVGGLQRGHCWFIPRTHQASSGIECKGSINGAVGAPMEA
ncbi:hypothetical protein, variant [Aphanomyces invadans]|nr:hypothetical protein, variant [Aphanomyces invadans]ETW04429.1 hypothetical protein, variant [Aphanomyces invadans]|eukprot:XP_008867385.1 hypothetical protein, variant [Aphanomyces invadans]